jgi:hypothetical protein
MPVVIPDASDMFYCSGFQGQMVAIIPSLDLRRMGLKETFEFDFNGFLVILSLKTKNNRKVCSTRHKVIP